MNTDTRREASLEVDGNISIGIDDVRGIISDLLSGTKDHCQSTVMGIINRNDRSSSTSDNPTETQHKALQDKEGVAKVLRDSMDELAPADLPKMSKLVRETVFDTIAGSIAEKLLEPDDSGFDFNKRV